MTSELKQTIKWVMNATVSILLIVPVAVYVFKAYQGVLYVICTLPFGIVVHPFFIVLAVFLSAVAAAIVIWVHVEIPDE